MDQNLEVTKVAAVVADELALVRRAATLDCHAFEQIMRRYNQRLYRLAISIMGEPSEAEDVLQESYVRAFYRLSGFAGKGDLGSWLASIVRNEAIDRLRARRIRGNTVTLEADLPSSDDDTTSAIDRAHSDAAEFNPELEMDREEMKEVLERAISSLPAHFRNVFMLREVEGLSVQETAEYLDLSLATVKTRDHRARLLLREKLNHQIDAATRNAFAFLGSRCDGLVARVLNRLQQ